MAIAGDIEKLDPKGNQNLKKVLRRNPFFVDFSDEELDIFLQKGDFFTCRSWWSIVKESTPATSFYVIISGQAEVRKDNKVLTSLGVGDTFGEMAALTGQPRTADIVCEPESITLRLSNDVLAAADAAFQLKLYKKFVNILAERLASTSAQLARVLY